MKSIAKYILIAGISLVFVLYLSCTLGISAQRRSSLGCTGLNVILVDSLKNPFVSKADIQSYLDKEFGEYIGKAVGELDLKKIEQIIDGKSAIAKSEAYTTADGRLNIEIRNREPVVRFQKGDLGFYADCQAYIFPLQKNYSSYVPIIDGNIPLKVNRGYKGELSTAKEKKWLEDVIEMINFIEKSKIWKNNIVQISVNSKGDIVLIPREGKERFIFGDPGEFEEKFKQMEYYYTAILPAKGEEYYTSVNVKYQNQIICRK